MDPLSVAASIIACCQAANAATKLCNKLGSLRHASSSLCALSNGIVDVALLVRRIDDLLITHATLNDRGLQLCQNQRENVDALKEHTDRLRTKLLELECLKAYRLQSAHGENKKVAWLRFQIKAERMQASLRQAKLDTSSPLTLLTSWVTQVSVWRQSLTSSQLGHLAAPDAGRRYTSRAREV